MTAYFQCRGCKTSIPMSGRTTTITLPSGSTFWWCSECTKVAKQAVSAAVRERKKAQKANAS